MLHRRYACWRVPLFSLQALLRVAPDSAAKPFALVTHPDRGVVLQASPRARELGIRPGMKCGQARALTPDIVLSTPRPEDETSALESLLEEARAFSPRVEPLENGGVVLDLGPRTDRRSEARLGIRMRRVVESRTALPLRIGIADRRASAILAAGLPRDLTIVDPGDDSEFLRPLGIGELDVDDQLRQRLDRWGIRSLGALAALPAEEVHSRLGRRGLRLRTSAKGEEPAPLTPAPHPPSFEERVDLEWALSSTEPLLFLLRAALTDLRKLLLREGLAAHRLELDLDLDTGAKSTIAVSLRTPSRDPRILLSLLRLELDESSLPSAVSGFVLRVLPGPAREVQLPLFGSPAPRADMIEMTLLRLLGILGERTRHGVLGLTDSHRPEALRIDPFELEGLHAETSSAPPRRISALRRLRTSPDVAWTGPGRPSPFSPTPSDEPRVLSGPWTLTAEWWTPAPLERETWDVELDAGLVIRAQFTKGKGAWAGVYD